MTAAQTIPYQSAHVDTCPLCRKRPVGKKKIYGYPVCKKCLYAFANRRQLGYLLDALLVLIPNIIIIFTAAAYLRQFSLDALQLRILLAMVGIPLSCLFIMKDGFRGQSPGKAAADVQVLDDESHQPIGFLQSFKRNSILLVSIIPVVGGVLALVVILIIATQVAGGYRLCDRFAKTRVIWKKYAQLPVFGGNALVCEKCGYDLNGNLSGICPECGTPVSARNLATLAQAAGPAEAAQPVTGSIV